MTDKRVITSTDNKRIKHIISLAQKKHRDAFSEFVAEGERWVVDAINSSSMSDIVSTIVINEQFLREYEHIYQKFMHKSIIVSDRVFCKICDTKNSQGILAVFNKAKSSSVIFDYCLYLDRIRDPGNLGTIIRTACAAGYKSVICDNCVDAYNPKTIRSCMGAILKLDVIETANGISFLEQIKKSEHKIFCARMDGVNVFDIDSKQSNNKICLIIGNEANGVRQEVNAFADIGIKIPMQSDSIESLNAAVSAGILMYQLKYFH